MRYKQGGAIDLLSQGTKCSLLSQEEGSCGEQMESKVYLVGHECISSLTNGVTDAARVDLSWLHTEPGCGGYRCQSVQLVLAGASSVPDFEYSSQVLKSQEFSRFVFSSVAFGWNSTGWFWPFTHLSLLLFQVLYHVQVGPRQRKNHPRQPLQGLDLSLRWLLGFPQPAGEGEELGLSSRHPQLP